MMVVIVVGLLVFAIFAGFKVRLEAEYDFGRVFTRLLILFVSLLGIAFFVNPEQTVENLIWWLDAMGLN